jgi:Zn-dependent oligopeptidase
LNLAVKNRAEITDLESRKLLDKLLSDFSRQGLAATTGHQRRLQEIDAELDRLETEYLHNLQLPEHFGIWVAGKELEGVPQRFQNASRAGDCSNDDYVRLKVGGRMQLLDLLSHVKGHKVRERLFSARKKLKFLDTPLIQSGQ